MDQKTPSKEAIPISQNTAPLSMKKTDDFSVTHFGEGSTKTGTADKPQAPNALQVTIVGLVVDTSSAVKNQNQDPTDQDHNESENCKAEPTKIMKDEEPAAKPHPKRPYKGRKAFPWRPSN